MWLSEEVLLSVNVGKKMLGKLNGILLQCERGCSCLD
jgi:hypothetical protein